MTDHTAPCEWLGSAVLVHGLWGNPDDWYWVRQHLQKARIHVQVVDLPSHRQVQAGRADDAKAVREAIRSCPTPVVAVGWSYGGSVISMAAAGESIAHLIYISHLPQPAQTTSSDTSWIAADPLLITGPDGRFTLDNDRWLREEGPSFPPEIQDHLRRHPRRLVSIKAFDAQTGAAWQTTPSTVLLGRSDADYPAEEPEQWATENPGRLRLLDSDHFIIFRQPDVVADAVIAALGA